MIGVNLFYGSMVLWFYGSIVLWFYRFMVLSFYDSIVLWSFGSMVIDLLLFKISLYSEAKTIKLFNHRTIKR
jgi:hypothetical protein